MCDYFTLRKTRQKFPLTKLRATVLGHHSTEQSVELVDHMHARSINLSKRRCEKGITKRSDKSCPPPTDHSIVATTVRSMYNCSGGVLPGMQLLASVINAQARSADGRSHENFPHMPAASIDAAGHLALIVAVLCH